MMPRTGIAATPRSGGWPGSAWLLALGGLAWASAFVLWTWWLPAERRQLAALEDAAASSLALAARLAARTAAAPEVRNTGERFFAAFAGRETRPQRVEALLAAAVAHEVAWQRTDFLVSRDAATGLTRYQVTLPVSGSYAAIRGFVDAALLADPAVALDRLQLRRPGLDATRIDAETVWSFFAREPAAEPRRRPAASPSSR